MSEKSRYIRYLYPYIKTLILYKPFFRKSGKHIVIINPIRLTPKFITLGNKILIHNNARIEGVSSYEGIKYQPFITIGDNVTIQQNIHLTCAGNISIGNNTAIASNVTISDITHGYEDINVPPEKQLLKIDPVVIGENCKLFNNVVILPGTKLGRHNIVGANSVVRGVFPDYSVIAGAPAKIKKRYNTATQGWEKTDDKGNFIK